MKLSPKLHASINLLGGCLATATGISLFLRPANIFSGGIPGIAIILINILGQDFHKYLGIIMFVLQVICLIIQLIFGGRSRLVKGVITAFIMSSLVQTITWFTLEVKISENGLLMAIAGSVLVGAGVGLVLNSGFNFAGTVGIADMISQKLRMPPGKVVLLFESGILVFGTFVIGLENALISAVGIFLMGRTINYITFGRFHYRQLTIVSGQADQIAKVLQNEVKRDISLIRSENVTENRNQAVLMVLIRHDRLGIIQDLVQSQDPGALIVASNIDNLIEAEPD